MKAFRVVTLTQGRAHLSIMIGNTQEEIRAQLQSFEEEIEIKEITNDKSLDITEVSEALRYYGVDEFSQLLSLSILEEYDNVVY